MNTLFRSLARLALVTGLVAGGLGPVATCEDDQNGDRGIEDSDALPSRVVAVFENAGLPQRVRLRGKASSHELGSQLVVRRFNGWHQSELTRRLLPRRADPPEAA